jgi:hypothetical protein
MGKSWVFLRDDVLAFLRKRIAEETELRRVRYTDAAEPTRPDTVLIHRKPKTRRTVLPDLPFRSTT